MTFKLNKQMLHPSPIKKSNGEFADAAFYEGTINALNFYASRGYGQFGDTPIFVKYIREWFKHGQRKM